MRDREKASKSKTMSAAMKMLQVSAIGTMLFSVGSVYAFNPDKALAAEHDNSVEYSISDSDYAEMTQSLAVYSYDDVRADNILFASIEWGASINLFEDNGHGNFSPDSPVSEKDLVKVVAKYFNLDGDYEDFSKYDVSLKGMNTTTSLGQLEQIVAELTGAPRGDLNAAQKFLADNSVNPTGSTTTLTKGQLANFLYTVHQHQLMVSSDSITVYSNNVQKAIDEADAKRQAEQDAQDAKDNAAQEKADKLAKEKADKLAKEKADKLAKEKADKLAKEQPLVISKNGKALSAAEKKKIAQRTALLQAQAKFNKSYKAKKAALQKKPPVKGAKIKKVTHYETMDYIKNGTVYKYYNVKWTKTSKTSSFGVAYKKATALDKLQLSKSGNFKQSGAKLTSKQSKVLAKYKKSSSLKKKYRYVITLDNSKKAVMHFVPKNKTTYKHSAKYATNISLGSTERFTVKYTLNKKVRAQSVQDAWNLGVLSKKGTLKGWKKAIVQGYNYYAGFTLHNDSFGIKNQ